MLRGHGEWNVKGRPVCVVKLFAGDGDAVALLGASAIVSMTTRCEQRSMTSDHQRRRISNTVSITAPLSCGQRSSAAAIGMPIRQMPNMALYLGTIVPDPAVGRRYAAPVWRREPTGSKGSTRVEQ